ncbi:hypothetical protein PMAYCL1PPCAC_33142, partial [Pristionchus mayeri]
MSPPPALYKSRLGYSEYGRYLAHAVLLSAESFHSSLAMAIFYTVVVPVAFGAFLITLFFVGGAVIPTIVWGIYKGGNAIYDWASGKHNCYHHLLLGEIHVNVDSLVFMNKPLEGCLMDRSVIGRESCFRSVDLSFDNKERFSFKVLMSSGAPYFPKGNSAFFQRSYTEDFK